MRQGEVTPGGPQFRAHLVREPDALLVLTGELDLAAAPYLRALVTSLDSADGDVVIDVTGLTFVDTSGFDALLDISTRVDGRVAVRGASAGFRRTRALIRADRALPDHPPADHPPPGRP